MKKALTDTLIRSLGPGTYFDPARQHLAFALAHTRRHGWQRKAGGGASLRSDIVRRYRSRRPGKGICRFIALELRRTRVTVEHALAEFLAQKGRWRPHTLKILGGDLRRFRWQGQVESITKLDVLRALDSIEARSARAHALKDARTFFNWCVGRYLERSPVEGIRMERQLSRDRVLTDAELSRVWIACDREGMFGDIVRLLILTGQRRTEMGPSSGLGSEPTL